MSTQERKHKARKKATVKSKRKSHRSKIRILLKNRDYDSLTELIIKRVNEFYVRVLER